jgi:tetratricopeptide (TPR) repeat protein
MKLRAFVAEAARHTKERWELLVVHHGCKRPAAQGSEACRPRVPHRVVARRFSAFCLRTVPFALLVLLLLAPGLWAAAQPNPSASGTVSIQGRVLDAHGNVLAGATVQLQGSPPAVADATQTNERGEFVFANLGVGSYTLTAASRAIRSHPQTIQASQPHQNLRIDLTLESSLAARSAPAAPSKPAPAMQAMQFADEPDFTVAAVTDWTAAGGHGSDSSLRTSEALTRETLALKPADAASTPRTDRPAPSRVVESENMLRAQLAAAPDSFDANHRLGRFYLDQARFNEALPLLQTAFRLQPANFDNEYDLTEACLHVLDLQQAHSHLSNLLAVRNTAGLHRLAAEIDEASGDPLAAVHEFEKAAQLDPTEQNYFAWGSELLLHRAVLQARQVFGEGVQAFPHSSRMLIALGGALFAGALYEDAAQRLCEASDLNPADPEAYLFMGKIDIAAPDPLPCVEQKLARFVQLAPGNALAHYFYAMAIMKQHAASPDAPTLMEVQTQLTRAVAIDPGCADAYLQLGILKATQKDYKAAIDDYQQAIRTNPQLSEAYYRLGVAYDRLGQRDEAARQFALHDAIRKQQAAEVDRQRREIKQFLVTPPAPQGRAGTP